MQHDYYIILGISRVATPQEIRTAYFEAARKLHPDTNPNPDAQEDFLLLQQAYEVLSSVHKRAEYNADLSKNRVQPELEVGVRYSQKVVPMIHEAQLYYVLLDIKSTTTREMAVTPPIQLCVVVDCSTSMQGARIEMVKATLHNVLKSMRKEDIFSVVAFSDWAEVIVPPTKIKEITQIGRQIDLLSIKGSTEIFKGLEMGLSQLRNNIFSSKARFLILITDGHTYGDEEKCYDLVKDASEQGIIVTGLGIGNDWNDAFLDKLTSLANGNVIYARTPKELALYLEEKIISIGSLYARNLAFRYSSDSEVELNYVFRLTPEPGPITLANPLKIGNLGYGDPIQLLFEFFIKNLPEDKKKIHLIKGRLHADLASGNASAGLNINFTKSVAFNPNFELPPIEIINALSKLTIFRMQEKARLEVERDDFQNAIKHLQFVATRLLSRGNQNLAQQVLIEAENVRQSHQFSQEGQKQVKYGTRALLLPSGKRSKLE